MTKEEIPSILTNNRKAIKGVWYPLKIFVDADACPVQDEVIHVCKMYGIHGVFIKSFSHFSHADMPPFIETIYVDHAADAADYKIVQLVKKRDIVITQDYGLASLVLGKGCYVLHHKGFQYTNKNIDTLLAKRHIGAQARKAGFRTKGPKPFTNDERNKFLLSLTRLVEKAKMLEENELL